MGVDNNNQNNKNSETADNITAVIKVVVVVFFLIVLCSSSCSKSSSSSDATSDTYTCGRCYKTYYGEPAMYSGGKEYCSACESDMEFAYDVMHGNY